MSLTYDPTQGFLLNGQRANLYGRVGRNVLDASTAAAGTIDPSRFDPRYYETYTFNNGDAGEQTGYRLRPEYQQRLNGRTQLASHSVGGYGEVIDPSQVEWDDEFGLLTDTRNIKDPATPRDNMIGNLAMAAWAAPMVYGIALDSGLLGTANQMGSAGFPAGAGPGSGPLLETAASGSLDAGALGAGGLEVSEAMRALLEQGTAAHGAAADAAAAAGVQEGLGVLNGLPTGVISTALGSGASSLLSNLNNPANLARLLMGGAGLVDAVRNNGNNNNNNNNTTTNYDLTLPEGVPSFNPGGLLGNYTPRQVGLVPFMSQGSLLGGR